jgi:hypothetical protein
MSIEFLNQLKPPQERDSGRKKNRGSEPNWAIIHINMEVPQENSLCSYCKQTKMSFFFYKIREQKDGTGLVWGRVGTSGKGEEVGKVHGRMNRV